MSAIKDPTSEYINYLIDEVKAVCEKEVNKLVKKQNISRNFAKAIVYSFASEVLNQQFLGMQIGPTQ